jgi:hypothetical protein
MTGTPEFHLCPEGEKLYREWYCLQQNIAGVYYQWSLSPDHKLVTATNAAWTAYQDHRSLCKDGCTKVRTP